MQDIEWSGDPISVPGLYKGIPLTRYHGPKICAGSSVSSSGLRQIMRESPAHFYCSWSENPQRIELKDTAWFRIGRATHHLLLGERWFARSFVIRPTMLQGLAWQGNRLECKGWLKEQAALGKTVLTQDDIEKIKGMAMALGRHPLVGAGILRGHIEHSIIWKDKKTGLWVKSRPDAIPTSSGDFSDLKTCQSVQWYDLQKDLNNYGYHAQGALVRMAAQQVLGISYKDFTFSLVCVEKYHFASCAQTVRRATESQGA